MRCVGKNRQREGSGLLPNIAARPPPPAHSHLEFSDLGGKGRAESEGRQDQARPEIRVAGSEMRPEVVGPEVAGGRKFGSGQLLISNLYPHPSGSLYGEGDSSIGQMRGKHLDPLRTPWKNSFLHWLNLLWVLGASAKAGNRACPTRRRLRKTNRGTPETAGAGSEPCLSIVSPTVPPLGLLSVRPKTQKPHTVPSSLGSNPSIHFEARGWHVVLRGPRLHSGKPEDTRKKTPELQEDAERHLLRSHMLKAPAARPTFGAQPRRGSAGSAAAHARSRPLAKPKVWGNGSVTHCDKHAPGPVGSVPYDKMRQPSLSQAGYFNALSEPKMDGSGKHECSNNSKGGRTRPWEGQRPWDQITDSDSHLLCDSGQALDLSEP